MVKDYIPGGDAEKLQWIVNFDIWLQANGAALGFSPAKLAEMAARAADFHDKMAAHETAHAHAKGATAEKNKTRTAAVALAREYAQQIQTASETTDGDRAAAGLTVLDTILTPAAADQILTITPPMIHLDFSVHGQVTIHWGPNPQNERFNGRPQGTQGCEIQVHRGGLPDHESEWTILDTDTNSPYIHIVHENEPTTYAYRVRYVGNKLKRGPFSNPAVCTVSV